MLESTPHLFTLFPPSALQFIIWTTLIDHTPLSSIHVLHYLPSHSSFLPQTLNVSLRESLVLSLCHSLYFPFLPPPSIIMALTLEGHLKCHIPVREPAWWCMVGHLFPFQSPNWLGLTVRRGREDLSGQSNICLLRWLIGTVSNLSAVSLHRARAYNRFRRDPTFLLLSCFKVKKNPKHLFWHNRAQIKAHRCHFVWVPMYMYI